MNFSFLCVSKKMNPPSYEQTIYFDKGYDVPTEKSNKKTMVYEQAIEKYKALEIVEEDDEIRKFIIEEKASCVDTYVAEYGFSDSDLWKEYVANNQPCVSTCWYKNETLHNSRLDKNGNHLPARIRWNGVIEFRIDGLYHNEDVDENGILMPAIIFPDGTVARCLQGKFVSSYKEKTFPAIFSPNFSKFIQNGVFHSLNEKKELCPASFIKIDDKIYHEYKQEGKFHSFYKNGEYVPASYVKCQNTEKIHPLYYKNGLLHSYRDINSKMLPASHVCYKYYCENIWYKDGAKRSWNPLGNSQEWMPAIEAIEVKKNVAPTTNLAKLWIISPDIVKPFCVGEQVTNPNSYYIKNPFMEMEGWKCYQDRIVSPTNVSYEINFTKEIANMYINPNIFVFMEHIYGLKLNPIFPPDSQVTKYVLLNENCFIVKKNNIDEFYIKNVKIHKNYFVSISRYNFYNLKFIIKGDVLLVYGYDTVWLSYSLKTGSLINIRINDKIFACGFMERDIFLYLGVEEDMCFKKYKVISTENYDNYKIMKCKVSNGLFSSDLADFLKFNGSKYIK